MFLPTYVAFMGSSRCPLSIRAQSCILAGLPSSITASMAALAVRPVKITSSTSTTVLSTTGKGTLVSDTMGSADTLERSSRYMAISSSPTGISLPSISAMFLASLLARGMPRVFMPIRHNPSVPWFFSTI